MHRSVWSRNFKNEEAMARVGPQRHKKKFNRSAVEHMWLNSSPSWRESHKHPSEVFSDLQNEVQQDEEKFQIIKEKSKLFLLSQ